MEDPRDIIKHFASSNHLEITSPDLTRLLEEKFSDCLQRDEFEIPTNKEIACDVELSKDTDPNGPCCYFAGNSLGLMPKGAKKIIDEELQVWKTRAVHGHFDHPFGRPWVSIDQLAVESMSKIVGALPNEVAIMATLTGNLHQLMVSFYTPTKTRYKILIEGKAFPSDHFAVESQVKFHGFDVKDALITLEPDNGSTISTESILKTLDKHGHEIATVLLGGIHYYTGQWFDLEAITKAAHSKGCMVGFDLAHAVGNVPLKLHDWNVDFACWCTYKYLNSGPGSTAGLFVHSRHANDVNRPRFAGWWGHDPKTRFTMDNHFVPIPGAAGYQLSNPSVLGTAGVLASLQVFSKTDMESLRRRSCILTAYFELLFDHFFSSSNQVKIITPRDYRQRGSQISLSFPDAHVVDKLLDDLQSFGIVCDARKPNVIRVAPTALYNTFEEVYKFFLLLPKLLSK